MSESLEKSVQVTSIANPINEMVNGFTSVAGAMRPSNGSMRGASLGSGAGEEDAL